MSRISLSPSRSRLLLCCLQRLIINLIAKVLTRARNLCSQHNWRLAPFRRSAALFRCQFPDVLSKVFVERKVSEKNNFCKRNHQIQAERWYLCSQRSEGTQRKHGERFRVKTCGEEEMRPALSFTRRFACNRWERATRRWGVTQAFKKMQLRTVKRIFLSDCGWPKWRIEISDFVRVSTFSLHQPISYYLTSITQRASSARSCERFLFIS